MEEQVKQFRLNMLMWFAILSVATVLVLMFTGDKTARERAMAPTVSSLEECSSLVQKTAKNSVHQQLGQDL